IEATNTSALALGRTISRSWQKPLLRRCSTMAIRKRPRSRRKAGQRARLTLEALEDRTAPAVFTVTTDSGGGDPGSFRLALANADATPGLDVINFNIPGSGVHTITPTGPLSIIEDSVIIDATTQPGYTLGHPVIELDGSQAGNSNGLEFRAGGNTVKGLIV